MKLGRQVIGIDVSVFALELINTVRFAGKYPALPIKGIPTDFDSAERLAQTNPFQFEKWAVWQTGMMPNVRQTGDSGIDGQGILGMSPEEGYTALTLAQVKGGKQRSYVADVERFCYTLIERNAACGVFITLRPIGKRSRVYATAGRLGRITIGNATYPRLQFWVYPGILRAWHAAEVAATRSSLQRSDSADALESMTLKEHACTLTHRLR